jgi:tetratricopeptide (TPR) repeat protein
MLGEIELQKGDPELARGFLERAVKLDPQNYYAHYALGRSYQKLGRTDDANREFTLQRSADGVRGAGEAVPAAAECCARVGKAGAGERDEGHGDDG